MGGYINVIVGICLMLPFFYHRVYKAVNGTVVPEETYRVVNAIITAYNNLPAQTDSTPDIMASGKKVYDGAIANNCLPFGTKVSVGEKVYAVDDRMNARYGCEYYDIFMWDYKDAINWGIQKKQVKIYE